MYSFFKKKPADMPPAKAAKVLQSLDLAYLDFV